MISVILLTTMWHFVKHRCSDRMTVPSDNARLSSHPFKYGSIKTPNKDELNIQCIHKNKSKTQPQYNDKFST
jgi:hypothetical protein